MAADPAEEAGSRSTAAHEAYVRQVVTALAAREIDVTDLEISAGRTRAASMKVVEREPFGPMGRDAEWITLRWDEREGWSYQVQYPDDGLPRGRVFFGFSNVPAPFQIAAWLTVGLAHPEIEPSHEDGPFETPDLEEILRAYAVTAG
jgi:hypothetical protein